MTLLIFCSTSPDNKGSNIVLSKLSHLQVLFTGWQNTPGKFTRIPKETIQILIITNYFSDDSILIYVLAFTVFPSEVMPSTLITYLPLSSDAKKLQVVAVFPCITTSGFQYNNCL